MTDPRHTPQPTAATPHQHPFTRDPGRWAKARLRALRTGHIRDHTCSAACQPVLVHERTPWGWLAWTVPGDGTLPEVPHQIGVLIPAATRTQRLAPRWLTRRPAQRIALDTASVSLRLATVAAAMVSLFAALLAMSHGVPLDIVLPAMLLTPLLFEHLPDLLDARARQHIRSIEGEAACRYLQRLATLHTPLVHAATSSERYELHRSAEIGHTLLWDAAELLQIQDTRTASATLITYERLMLQLADQVAQILTHTAEPGRADTDPTRQAGRSWDPYPPHPGPTMRPAPRPTPGTPPLKGTVLMPQPVSGPAVRAADLYLLFAHEPYYPGPGTQEINTTVVAVDSLLHPQVCQPDGARIHDLLARGRQPGEIIPLSTLTHELGGGADWPAVGDWERVTTDLVQLVHSGNCDALSLGLPEIARALVCSGPHSHVRAFDAAADQFIAYGPTERAAVLAEVGTFLARLVAERALWPGDGLLAPLEHRV